MGFKTGISLLCCCVIVFLRIKTVRAEFVCYQESGNFTANSTFSKNRADILGSLGSNAGANANARFYNSSVGDGSDTVYATALCLGDALPIQCSTCVNSAALNLISNCPLQYEAVSWDDCVVHYSNNYIFGVLEMDPCIVAHNTVNTTWIPSGFYRCVVGHTGTISSNSSGFYQTWSGLAEKVKNKAIAGSSTLKYAEDKANYTLTEYIYAHVQCTPDLSQSDCDKCLTQSIADYENTFSGNQAGLVYRPNCYFRWDFYLFYDNGVDNLNLFYNETDNNSPPPSPVPSSTSNGGLSAQTIAIVVGSVVIFIALVAVGLILFRRLRRRRMKTVQLSKVDEDVTSTSDFLHLDFRTIRVATDNFSDNKKLGQGGFGIVYKGTFSNGQDIAVKRLSRNSLQGELEFKTEVKLMSKLRQRNLVRLIGFSMEKEERVLVYEFLPNSSLDRYIFHPNKGCLLDWTKRYHIISGIARGLLYLHEDSHLRIIHRDLKPGNILIDAEMNAKIADFGTARLFAYDQTQDNTSRISGTFGYMAPEYVTHGQFSVKSDVFSFGVLALEIISGQRNMRVENGELIGNLVTNAWRNWDEGNALNLIDPILKSGSRSEMLRCIQIGLLCVQENAADRPNMASVVLMLSTESLPLSAPLKPAYFLQSFQNRSELVEGSTNGVTISDLYP